MHWTRVVWRDIGDIKPQSQSNNATPGGGNNFVLYMPASTSVSRIINGSPMSPPLSSILRPCQLPLRRLLTDRAAGPGGLFRSSTPVVNPSARKAAASRSRLRALRADLEERSRADVEESTPAFEDEGELRDFVEMRIQESMREGGFDNLKNKGRPLPDSGMKSSVDVAMRIMRDNRILPHWLQLMNDIDEEKRRIRKEMQWAWHRYMPHRQDKWEGVLRVMEMRWQDLNKEVDRFNLVRPMCVRHLFRLRIRKDEEIRRAMESEKPKELLAKENATQETQNLEQKDAKQEKEEPRPTWQLFARFVRAEEVREYDRPTWGRRRNSPPQSPGNGKSNR